jgi:hypothetical protein
MRRAVVVVGLLFAGGVGSVGCVRQAESIVRDRAATDFACADYALHVEEVGPDVYRASGCGQELIYACRAERTHRPRHADTSQQDEDFSDKADEPAMVCARNPR